MRAEHSDVSVAAAAGYPPHNCGWWCSSSPLSSTLMTVVVVMVSVPGEYDYGHQTVTLLRPWPESFALLLVVALASNY